MSYNLTQFSNLIGRVITAQELFSPVALNLLLGTAAVESAFGTYLVQIGGGPARGVFQMEPATEKDIWKNYLYMGRVEKRAAIYNISSVRSYANNGALEWNIAYGICMSRLHYRRIAEPFPAADDVEGLGWYWDVHYNRNPLKGTVKQFVEAYERYVTKDSIS